MHLKPVIDNKVVTNKNLWVFSTHLGLGEDEKAKSMKLIPVLMKEIAGDDPAIEVGDHNLFYDLQGAVHEKIPTLSAEYPLEHWTGSDATLF